MMKRQQWQTVLLWVFALLLINGLWVQVSGQTAPNEVNSEDQFQTYREIEVSAVFGSSSAIPATFAATFQSTSVDKANVSFTITLDNTTTVHAWSGQLGDVVPVWSGELAPGTYTVQTVVEEGVTVTQTLELQPFGAVQTVGHFGLSLMLIAFALGEKGVRGWWSRRVPSQRSDVGEKIPFKAKKFANEDEQVSWNDADSPWRDPLR